MIVAILIAALALIATVTALPHARWRHAIAFCVCLSALTIAVVTALGDPRPSWTLFAPVGKARVVGAVFDEPNHIFLWVRRGSDAPISLALPWNEQQAAQLQQAMQAAQLSGQGIEARGDAQEGGANAALRFYATPQQAGEPKGVLQ